MKKTDKSKEPAPAPAPEFVKRLEPSNECPKYFRLHVSTAQGSREGYREAGYHLGIHLDDHARESAIEAFMAIEREAGEGYRQSKTSADTTATTEKRYGALWGWLGEALPRCRALVPARRRNRFLEGLLDGAYKAGLTRLDP